MTIYSDLPIAVNCRWRAWWPFVWHELLLNVHPRDYELMKAENPALYDGIERVITCTN